MYVAVQYSPLRLCTRIFKKRNSAGRKCSVSKAWEGLISSHMKDSPIIVLSVFKPVELRGKLYFPVVVVCNLLVSPSQSQGGKASGSELWHFWAGRAAGLCVHGRKHSPPALALVLPRERALQNKAGRFNLIPCAETSSHGFEERCLV